MKGSCQLLAREYRHLVLVNRLGGASLPRNSVVRLTVRPNMTIADKRGRKATTIAKIHTHSGSESHALFAECQLDYFPGFSSLFT